jgi:hypothetical protein
MNYCRQRPDEVEIVAQKVAQTKKVKVISPKFNGDKLRSGTQENAVFTGIAGDEKIKHNTRKNVRRRCSTLLASISNFCHFIRE